jgi:PAP2 superfamily
VTRLQVRRPAPRRNLVQQPAPARRAGLTWPRLPAAAEVAIIGAGYLAYALVRLAVRADGHAAFGHAAELWRAERWLHLDVEPSLNHLVAAGPALAEATGYYYGLLHFIVTPLVLGWLYLRRPSAFPRLRSALVLASANHFLLDTAGGLAVLGLGLLGTAGNSAGHGTSPGSRPPGSAPGQLSSRRPAGRPGVSLDRVRVLCPRLGHARLD